MTQTGSSAWWTDVQHLRDAAERTDEARRRADQADLAARRASRERREVEAEVAHAPTPALPAATTPVPVPRRRFEPETAQPQPRRRDHADAAPAPRRPETTAPVARRGGFGDTGALAGRRTIEIRGRTVGAPAVPPTPSVELDRARRSPRRAIDRSYGPRPDRLAMWALVMGLMLIAVAITTASPT
jgi:hypothetical protein